MSAGPGLDELAGTAAGIRLVRTLLTADERGDGEGVTAVLANEFTSSSRPHVRGRRP